MGRFENNSVIVTGAGSGFGKATVQRFAAEGAKVYATDINEENLHEVVAQTNEEIGAAVCYAGVCDVAREADVTTMVEDAVTTMGGLDILVNNAGYSHRQRLMWKISVEDFDAVFAVNVRGVFLGCKYAIPHLIENGGGVIINVASVGAIAPRPGVTPYNATKGAVLTLTKGLAMELAPNNIRVNAVNPVAADTGFMQGAMGIEGGLTEEWTERLVETIPRGRLCEPDDVAASITFLASKDADFLTGTAINVDGGRSV